MEGFKETSILVRMRIKFHDYFFHIRGEGTGLKEIIESLLILYPGKYGFLTMVHYGPHETGGKLDRRLLDVHVHFFSRYVLHANLNTGFLTITFYTVTFRRRTV